MTWYTARLENWQHSKKENVMIGNIYDDKNGRWRDGELIKTSKLLPMSMQVGSPHEGGIIITQNNTYLLGSKK